MCLRKCCLIKQMLFYIDFCTSPGPCQEPKSRCILDEEIDIGYRCLCPKGSSGDNCQDKFGKQYGRNLIIYACICRYTILNTNRLTRLDMQHEARTE